MMNVGRLCLKVAGREAGKKCVIIEAIDGNYVMIDGQVKRKKCNIDHLEPLSHELDISQGASHEEVVKALKTAGIDVFKAEKKWHKAMAAKKAARAAAPKAAAEPEKAKKAAQQKAKA